MTSREAVVTEAETWLGTKWHHNARIKGVGVDCANLPLAAYSAAGLIPDLRPVYDRQWAQHRDEEKFLDFVRQYAREIPVFDAKLGDLLIWKFDRTYSHGGIVTAPGEVIHAWVRSGVIRTNWLQYSAMNTQPVKAFTLWDD